MQKGCQDMNQFNAVTYLTDGTANKVLTAHYVKNHKVDVNQIEIYLKHKQNLNQLIDLVKSDNMIKNLLSDESSTIIAPIIYEMATYSKETMPLVSKIIYKFKKKQVK